MARRFEKKNELILKNRSQRVYGLNFHFIATSILKCFTAIVDAVGAVFIGGIGYGYKQSTYT